MSKYANGAANIRLSSLSNIPPWPGKIAPLSFTPATRLNLDSRRSPKFPVITTTVARMSHWLKDSSGSI